MHFCDNVKSSKQKYFNTNSQFFHVGSDTTVKPNSCKLAIYNGIIQANLARNINTTIISNIWTTTHCKIT